MSKHYKIVVGHGTSGFTKIVTEKELEDFIAEGPSGFILRITKEVVPAVELKRGQIWAPVDEKVFGSGEAAQFRITDIGAERVTVSRMIPMRGQPMFRTIRKNRFRTNSRGYKLVKDVEAEQLQLTGT